MLLFELESLWIGTSYLTAYDLLEDLERAKKILNVSDKVSGRLSLALKAEANRWLKEYVIDSVESFGNGHDWESEYQPSMFDCYIEDWETFVKKKIHDAMLKNLNPYSILYGFCDGLGEFLTEDISLDQVEEAVKDCVSEYVWDLNLEYKDDREDRDVDTADDYRYEMAQYQNDIRAVEKLFIESC